MRMLVLSVFQITQWYICIKGSISESQRMDVSSFSSPQNSHGIMDHDDQEEEHDLCSSSLSSSSSDVSIHSNGSASSSSDLTGDASSFSSSSSSSSGQLLMGPLYEMTSLIEELPFKRGLSKHFKGKSQSFTSLSNVRCLEDLAKREKYPWRKKLKSCKRYGGGLHHHRQRSYKPKTAISKKYYYSSRSSSWGSLVSRRKKASSPYTQN